MSMEAYYRARYKDKDGGPLCLAVDQPLLYVNQNQGEATHRIYLPTELCHVANLPKSFTKDRSKMRDLQKYKIMNAQMRRDKIAYIHNAFVNEASKMKTRGVYLEKELMNLKGKKLHPPKLMDPGSDCGNLRSFQDF